MANPFIGQAKSTSKAKFKSITGKTGGGQAFDGDKQGAPKVAKKVKGGGDTGSGPVYGGKSKGRLDKYARGGAAKGNVNIAIVLPSKAEEKPEEMMMPPPEMMGPPPEPPPPPPDSGPAPNIMAPIMPPPVMPPEGPPVPPMMRAHGGRLPKAGAETGVGRLQKAKLHKKK